MRPATSTRDTSRHHAGPATSPARVNSRAHKRPNYVSVTTDSGSSRRNATILDAESEGGHAAAYSVTSDKTSSLPIKRGAPTSLTLVRTWVVDAVEGAVEVLALPQPVLLGHVLALTQVAADGEGPVAGGIPFIPDQDLQAALDKAGVPAKTADAIIAENADAAWPGCAHHCHCSPSLR
jgi:hypothetical protein